MPSKFMKHNETETPRFPADRLKSNQTTRAEERRLPHFILIDPSIQDYQGHYYEYALRVVKAAERKGFKPVIASNRKFSCAQEDDVSIQPVYRYGFWLTESDFRWQRVWKRLGRAIAGRWFAMRAHLRYSQWSLAWLRRTQSTAGFRRRAFTGGLRWSLVGPLLVEYLLGVLRAVAAVVGQAIPFRKKLGWLLGYPGRYAARLARPLTDVLRSVAVPVTQLFDPRGSLRQWVLEELKISRFARDTQRLISRLRAGDDDHAVLSVVSPAEMMSLARVFRRNDRARRMTWHLIFRHKLYQSDDAQRNTESVRPLRNVFHEFQQAAPPGQVRFYTDTEELTAQYNSLGMCRFRTLPVPVAAEYHQHRRRGMPRGPIRIGFVGDARPEKGYHFLPQLVNDLWSDYVRPGKVDFTLQSNFNLAGGAPESIVARAQLDALPSDRVRLLWQPLTPSEYRDLVLQSDILLMPYDSRGYFARSSGIFSEAVTVGTPVVAAAGTWMARHLTAWHYQHHCQVRRESEVVLSLPADDLAWRIQGMRNSRPLRDGCLRLCGAAPRVCRISRPRRSTALLIRCNEQACEIGQFIRVAIEQFGRGRKRVARQVSVIGGDDGAASLLLPIDRATRRLAIHVSNAYCDAAVELADVCVDFLHTSAAVPLGAVGAILTDPHQMRDAVEEILKHYAHYRKTAEAVSVAWSQQHNPARLVEDILANDNDAPATCGRVLVDGSVSNLRSA